MIHYHGTPASGPKLDAAKFLKGRNALIPFPAPVDLAVALAVCQTVVLDNGAFSIWKRGGTLDVEGYHAWVDKVRHHPAFRWALIPDVIDGDEAANDRLLAQWPFGNHGVPVWHLHESLERLKRIAGAWPTVALGSSGQWPSPGNAPWWERMNDAMNAIDIGGGRPACQLHGLRMLNPAIFTRLPLASADSTNAVRNANLVRHFGHYAPPTLGQRQAAIADRIEAHQSAAVWAGIQEEPNLWDAVATDLAS